MLPILIVDDEPSIAQLIAMTLEPLGQPLIIAHDGERAADLLETQNLTWSSSMSCCRASTVLR